MIVLTTTAASIDEAAEQVRSQAAWIGGVELRVDLLESSERERLSLFPSLLSGRVGKPLSLICTVRRVCDGGRWSGDEPDRRRLLEAAVGSGFEFIDLEGDLPADGPWQELALRAERVGMRVIRSIHDFDGVPTDLARLVRDLPRTPGEIAKAAVTPRSTADVTAVVVAARELGDQPRILLGMGEYGFPTRVLQAVLGNFLTFASVPGASAAPGHVAPEELATGYRLASQRPATSLFAVIGNPIGHSRSPAYHNRRFAADGIDACYVPVLVDRVDDFFALAAALPILGFSVTIPHKRSVMRHLTDIGEDVRAADACNTVLRTPSGWRGVNTDVIGFLAPLDEVCTEPLAGRRVLVLGAGGAARGVVYALISRGADVFIWNRTASRARELSRDLARLTSAENIMVVDIDAAGEPIAPRADIVVNTTSLGMHGEGDPAPWYEFDGHEIVYDIVYTPPQTPLIRRAADAGCRIVTGDRMFDAQAAAQYELYRVLATGAAPDA